MTEQHGRIFALKQESAMCHPIQSTSKDRYGRHMGVNTVMSSIGSDIRTFVCLSFSQPNTWRAIHTDNAETFRNFPSSYATNDDTTVNRVPQFLWRASLKSNRLQMTRHVQANSRDRENNIFSVYFMLQ